MWAGPAAGAVVALLVSWLLLFKAAGKPALQALSAGLTLVTALMAYFAWPCTRGWTWWAALPLVLAGK